MSGPSERDEVAADREALTDALYADKDLGPGYMLRDDCEHLADRFLASDWLAERDRRVRAEALREAARSGPIDFAMTHDEPKWRGYSHLVTTDYLRARADRIERAE